MPVQPASIREIDLFAALSPADVARVAGFMREQQIPRKGVILLEGARGDGFYYVQSGLVQGVPNLRRWPRTGPAPARRGRNLQRRAGA